MLLMAWVGAETEVINYDCEHFSLAYGLSWKEEVAVLILSVQSLIWIFVTRTRTAEEELRILVGWWRNLFSSNETMIHFLRIPS